MQRRARLVRYLRNLRPEVSARLTRLKLEGEAARLRPDFLWYFLLTSFSTMGNSRGFAGLMSDPDHLQRLSYDSLLALEPAARQAAIEAVLRRAKIRMPAQKAQWLARNLIEIQAMGGLAEANAAAFRQPHRAAKIEFLKQFAGIGDEYARNIWMDVYDPAFHDAVAIDQRIKNVSTALGVSFTRYLAHESYYQELAGEAGLQPWELDRVLYWTLPDVLGAIRGEEQHAS